MDHKYLRYVSLFDPRWKVKRKQILERDNYKCRICGNSEGHLSVHHKQYHFIKRLQKHLDPWDYVDKLMITVCESCHNRGHHKYKVPIKYI
ncbi:MAG: HNH endonuclease [Sphingobacteriales bacterium]|nr:MAG: HNH endonuclease [Sphingobacteriales bacterium]